MCEQMGWEIDEKQLPKDPSNLSFEVQQALENGVTTVEKLRKYKYNPFLVYFTSL